MTTFNLQEAVAKAKAAYDAMTPAQQARHDMEQRRSFVRGMCPSNMEFDKWCEVVDRTMPYSGYDFLAGELEKRDAEIERLRADNERLLTILGAATMAKNRLNTFADQANAGDVHYDARELKRKIWGAFSDFDAALDIQQSATEKSS
jgi:hypothetical protein